MSENKYILNKKLLNKYSHIFKIKEQNISSNYNINNTLNDNKIDSIIIYKNNNNNCNNNSLPSPNKKSISLATVNFISECQCCKKHFDNNIHIPYMFKCNHFFCLKCIKQNFTSEDGSIHCPIDGKIANSILEIPILKNPTSENHHVIGFTNELPQNIFNLHQNFCKIHKNQKLSHIITNTNEVVCVHCAFEKLKENPNFEIISIKDKYNMIINCIDKIINNCQKNIKLIGNTMNLIKKNKENEETKLNIFYDNIIKCITLKQKEDLIKINDVFITNQAELSQKLDTCKDILEQSMEFKKTLNFGVGCDISKNYSNAMNNLSILEHLQRSIEEDNNNNKLKYIKFINESENEIIDYIKNACIIKIIDKKFKIIKIDLNNNEDNYNKSIFDSFQNTPRDESTSKKINVKKRLLGKKPIKINPNFKFIKIENLHTYSKLLNITQDNSNRTKSVHNLLNKKLNFSNYKNNNFSKDIMAIAKLNKNLFKKEIINKNNSINQKIIFKKILNLKNHNTSRNSNSIFSNNFKKSNKNCYKKYIHQSGNIIGNFHNLDSLKTISNHEYSARDNTHTIN